MLSGELARRSDELLDEYVSYLIPNKETYVGPKVRIVALCFNILQDTSGIAEIKSSTRRIYNESMESTLDVFQENSEASESQQLQVLDMLAEIGSHVKNHLISATKSARLSVRSRAIDLLVPHLPDNDLFNMDYIFDDRSRETIKTYLLGLMNRDPARTERLLEKEKNFSEKTERAIAEIFPIFLEGREPEGGLALASSFLTKMQRYAAIRDLLNVVIQRLAKHKQTWELITRCACEDEDAEIRLTALELLAESNMNKEKTMRFLAIRSKEDELVSVRFATSKLLRKLRGA